MVEAHVSSSHPTSDPAAAPHAAKVEHLTKEQCWALAESASFGRLAVQALDGMPDVFPVNYTVHDGSIYIRSAPGSKLMAIVRHPVAAFEIDGEDDRVHWSVVLRGDVRRLAVDREIHESGIQSVVSDSPTEKFNYVCVTPITVTGRRFAKRTRVGEGAATGSADDAAIAGVKRQRPGPPRPTPIAHFPPLAMPVASDPHA